MTDLTMGQRIAECRKRLGLSQEALGEKMGVSRQAISKWEADGAVPEIDKLIALSKLFNVSVGWLLGVEKMPEPKEESSQISEELLRKIEQIVLRYRPQKKKLSTGKIILIAIAAALVLWGGYHLLEEWSITRNEVGYLSAQIRNSNEQNSNILHQLDALEDRIDGINTTVEEAAATLASYEFLVTPNPETETARVVLSAVPKSWNKEYAASLSVRYEGRQLVNETCYWDGSALVTAVELYLLDGYEYWLLVQHPDGTQEQVQLKNTEVQDLKSSLSITCQVNFGNLASWSLDSHYVSLKVYDVYLQRPVMLGDGEKSNWTKAEFVLYHIRGAERTLADRKSILHEDVKDIVEFWYEGTLSLAIPDIEVGDRLELWIEAELANGIACSQQAATWEYHRTSGFVLSGR